MKKNIFLILLLISIALAVFLSPFASSSPDGLDYTAEILNFADASEGKELFQALIPDYAVPFISNEKLSTSAAGLIGTLLMFAVPYGIGKIIGNKKNESL
ncbi:MAG: PDGLE domain-containing protein [bacterium]